MKKSILFIGTLLVLLLGLSSFLWLYEGSKLFIGRADISRASFSLENSYVFVTPLQATANGDEKIRITVFVLNNQGLGVLGKKVTINPTGGVFVETIQGLTDNTGKAVFDTSSRQAGDFYLPISVEDTILPQRAHLSFH